MITWEEPRREPIRDNRGQPTGQFHSFQVSRDPPGYIINLVPYGDLCHLQCLHWGERITHIGTHENIDRRDRGGKNAAAAALRAACEAHATAAASRADPPAD